VTATNRALEELVRAGRFRPDLYYRVAVASLVLPALREIASDVPVLADHFRELFNREFKKRVESIEPAALEVLQHWSWPGNVRELRNVIERAMMFSDGPALTRRDLPALGDLQLEARQSGGRREHMRIPRGLTLEEAEREYIRHTLEDTSGNIQRAAEILGISRKNLWEKRKKYGLLPPDTDAGTGSAA
jgi:DNA-binding NtrC family response regulator